MTRKQTEKFIKLQISDRLPEYHVRGHELFAVPIGLMFNTIAFGSSSWEKNAFSHVYADCLALWVRQGCAAFSHPIDLSSVRSLRRIGMGWTKDPAEIPWMKLIEHIALPMFSRIGTPLGLLDQLTSLMDDEAVSNGYEAGYQPGAAVLEELAGAAIICCRLEEAAKHLAAAIDCYVKHPEFMDDPTYWGVKKLDDLRLLEKKLNRSRGDAIDLLKEWDAFTVASLKLEPFLAPNRWDV